MAGTRAAEAGDRKHRSACGAARRAERADAPFSTPYEKFCRAIWCSSSDPRTSKKETAPAAPASLIRKNFSKFEYPNSAITEDVENRHHAPAAPAYIGGSQISAVIGSPVLLSISPVAFSIVIPTKPFSLFLPPPFFSSRRSENRLVSLSKKSFEVPVNSPKC